jgi:hypothetical protein
MKIDYLQLEWIKSYEYKYFGFTVNSSNSTEEEIKGRSVLGNIAYCANQSLFEN